MEGHVRWLELGVLSLKPHLTSILSKFNGSYGLQYTFYMSMQNNIVQSITYLLIFAYILNRI
uniref:Uncharacterized protein n=1 Tax=Anguilla anguilla TaxID=7936 RepID=A0A0E9PMD3_ANGAN